jgi:hypothetical protein
MKSSPVDEADLLVDSSTKAVIQTRLKTVTIEQMASSGQTT